jgi:hypothetical protein
MPGIWQGRERPHSTKYQMLVMIMLLGNQYWVRIVSPSLVAICQYLSSTVRDLGPFIFPMEGKGQTGSANLERNNMWKQ